MNSLRRWLYRPKRSDSSLLAQFYFADDELNSIAAELDSFEGRKDPERCTSLVNQLRSCQARVLSIVFQMMDESVKEDRAPRDFRVKFPDDVIQDNLAGQLWFGAECLAAGSSIMNRETESAAMRPLARALTKNLDSLRTTLRDQCLKNVHEYTQLIKESLVIFDKLFAEFELSYVSAMVPVKSAHEYDMIQEITVLFSETVQRALNIGLLIQDTIDEYDPALMFTIPRLAIVSGVLVFKDGPLNPDNDPWNMSEMFRPFQTLLIKIRELLTILTEEELWLLESALCSQAEPSFLATIEKQKRSSSSKSDRKRTPKRLLSITRRAEGEASENPKQEESEGDDNSIESELMVLEIAKRLEELAHNFEASRSARTQSENSQTSVKEEKSNGLDTQQIITSSSSSSLSSSSLSTDEEGETEQTEMVQSENVSKKSKDGETQTCQNTSGGYGRSSSFGSKCTSDAGSAENRIKQTLPELMTISISDVDPESVLDSTDCASPSHSNTLNSNQCLPHTLHVFATNSALLNSDLGSNLPENTDSSVTDQSMYVSHNEAPLEEMPFFIGGSTDSGLFSDFLSQSDSLFTISSSDSHQQLTVTSSDVSHYLVNTDMHSHQAQSVDQLENEHHPGKDLTSCDESPSTGSPDAMMCVVPSSPLHMNQPGHVSDTSAAMSEYGLCDTVSQDTYSASEQPTFTEISYGQGHSKEHISTMVLSDTSGEGTRLNSSSSSDVSNKFEGAEVLPFKTSNIITSHQPTPQSNCKEGSVIVKPCSFNSGTATNQRLSMPVHSNAKESSRVIGGLEKSEDICEAGEKITDYQTYSNRVCVTNKEPQSGIEKDSGDKRNESSIAAIACTDVNLYNCECGSRKAMVTAIEELEGCKKESTSQYATSTNSDSCTKISIPQTNSDNSVIKKVTLACQSHVEGDESGMSHDALCTFPCTQNRSDETQLSRSTEMSTSSIQHCDAVPSSMGGQLSLPPNSMEEGQSSIPPNGMEEGQPSIPPNGIEDHPCIPHTGMKEFQPSIPPNGICMHSNQVLSIQNFTNSEIQVGEPAANVSESDSAQTINSTSFHSKSVVCDESSSSTSSQLSPCSLHDHINQNYNETLACVVCLENGCVNRVHSSEHEQCSKVCSEQPYAHMPSSTTEDLTHSKNNDSHVFWDSNAAAKSTSADKNPPAKLRKRRAKKNHHKHESENMLSLSRNAYSDTLTLPSLQISNTESATYTKISSDREGGHSSDTSSYTSDSGDKEEIALAMEAAEKATRKKVRAQFRNSSDMIHRLFVCISGVADQLQTNFAGDLRNILRAVFDMHCSQRADVGEMEKTEESTPLGAAYRAIRAARRARSANHRQEPPSWVPDEQTNECMSCQVPFTFVRRRHHCRNCGKIFCSRCASNFVPLPHFGQEKDVRVCNRCFMFRVTPFTVRPGQ